MKKNFTLVVCGLGRCGTSLAMQLLDACGIDCHGTYPSYEEDDCNTNAFVKSDILQGMKGKAVKIIDPHHGFLSFENCRVIYLTRDSIEQAKSQIKMATIMFQNQPPPSMKLIKRMASSLRSENATALDYIKKNGAETILRITFESLILYPERFIDLVGLMIGEKISYPQKPIVYARSVKCMNGFLEAELLSGNNENPA